MRESTVKAVALDGYLYEPREKLVIPRGKIALLLSLCLVGVLVLKVSLTFNIQETRYSLEQARDLHRQLKDELSELQYQRQTIAATLFAGSHTQESAMQKLSLQPVQGEQFIELTE